LASERYVEKQPHSHIYRLTSMVQKLSSGFGESDLFLEVAKPIVHRAGAEIRWPLALATPDGCEMVVRIATDHETPLAIDRYFIGFHTPMLHAPTGICYLAFCEEAKRASILERAGFSRDQASRRTELDIDYELERVRQQGYCHRRFAQYREGGLAVPLFADGRVAGGIVMRYTKSTLRPTQLEEHYVPIVQKIAADISEAYQRRLTRDLPELDEPFAGAAPSRETVLAPVAFAIAARTSAPAHLTA
jgi:IclR family mhp operon transcriptional activator